MTTWRTCVFYGFLASCLGVASMILISSLLGSWDQLNQRHFWIEKACGFAGAFPGFVLLFYMIQSHRAKQQEERNQEGDG
jgi:hypothetical protein